MCSRERIVGLSASSLDPPGLVPCISRPGNLPQGRGGSNPAVVPHDLVGEPGAQESKLLLPFWAGAISKFIPFLP